MIDTIDRHLDQIEATPPPRALVTHGSGRFFSTGLDLDEICRDPDVADDLVQAMHRLFARMLGLPLPTVAALNGHTFAGGALFALTHDRRVMRVDRGYFCLPEVDGKIAFTPGFSDLLATRLGLATAHEAATSGRRYTATEAQQHGIVEAAAPAEELLELAISIAASLADKDPATLGTIKGRLHGGAIASLLDVEANAVEAGDFAAIIAATSKS